MYITVIHIYIYSPNKACYLADMRAIELGPSQRVSRFTNNMILADVLWTSTFFVPFKLQRESPSTTRVTATASFSSPMSTSQMRNSLFFSNVSPFKKSNGVSSSSLPDPGFQILASRSWLPQFGFQILATRSWLPGHGCHILASRSWLPDPSYLELSGAI